MAALHSCSCVIIPVYQNDAYTNHTTVYLMCIWKLMHRTRFWMTPF